MELMGPVIVFFLLAILFLIILAKTAVVVPQQSAYVVERLGKYSNTLEAGFHVLVPFLDAIRYKHTLKEQAWMFPSRSASQRTTFRSVWTAFCTSRS